MLERTRARLAAHAPVCLVPYGDSITEVGRTPGYFGGASTEAMNWGHQLGRLLIEALPGADVHVRNFGIGGQNSYEGLGRLDWLPSYEPDLVLVAFGANDSGWHHLPPEATEQALRTLVEGIQVRYGVDVVVMGMGGENPLDYGMAHMNETLAATRAAAEARGVPFVDTRAAVLAATEGGTRWAEFHHGTRDCHPNDAGHAVWARAACEVILGALQG
jgi:lysophospholipase L1-like esterase